jgi:hypothetical protein
MTTPVGTAVQYFPDPVEGLGGSALPGLLAASGPSGDDGATIIIFTLAGGVAVRNGVLTRATWQTQGGRHGASWGPVQ